MMGGNMGRYLGRCTLNIGLVINYGEGAYKMGKLWVRNFLCPPPFSVHHPQAPPPPPPLFLRVETFYAPTPSIWSKI